MIHVHQSCNKNLNVQFSCAVSNSQDLEREFVTSRVIHMELISKPNKNTNYLLICEQSGCLDWIKKIRLRAVMLKRKVRHFKVVAHLGVPLLTIGRLVCHHGSIGVHVVDRRPHSCRSMLYSLQEFLLLLFSAACFWCQSFGDVLHYVCSYYFKFGLGC